MIVKELIEALSKMPQDAKVFHVWDGEPRTEISIVYEAKNGSVITIDHGEPVYAEGYRPKDAPTKQEQPRWEAPENPTEDYVRTDEYWQ